MIARGESDHAPLPFLRRELEQAVGRAAELEGAAGLQAFAFQPDADAVDFAFDQGRPLDLSRNPLGRIDNVIARDVLASSIKRVDNPVLSLNRCSLTTKLPQIPSRGPKKLYRGDPRTYIALRCPMGLPTARQLFVELACWRSLELHKHHRALGLAAAPTGSRGAAAIAKLRPVQPVTLLRPHAARRAARFFVEKFPGRSLYAVKANPSPDLLRSCGKRASRITTSPRSARSAWSTKPCLMPCSASCIR